MCFARHSATMARKCWHCLCGATYVLSHHEASSASLMSLWAPCSRGRTALATDLCTSAPGRCCARIRPCSNCTSCDWIASAAFNWAWQPSQPREAQHARRLTCTTSSGLMGVAASPSGQASRAQPCHFRSRCIPSACERAIGLVFSTTRAYAASRSLHVRAMRAPSKTICCRSLAPPCRCAFQHTVRMIVRHGFPMATAC
mmetsp:Transcript_5201/g.13678  ORF Transcript_5201/g.13678 Transcript_5201/m.13678 type:complete len:200 (+) Transcript_5201:597-1196(+)